MYVGGYTDAEGVDYVYQNYSLSFKDGETSKLLIIRIIDDNIVEPDENYTLVINANTLNGRIIVGENGTTTITILDDDGKYSNYAYNKITYVICDKNLVYTIYPVCK